MAAYEENELQIRHIGTPSSGKLRQENCELEVRLYQIVVPTFVVV